MVWTLLEYLMHRFLFHSSVSWAEGLPRPLGGAVNVIRLLMHTVHHAHPADKLRIATPLPMSIVIAALVLPPLYALLSLDSARAVGAGLIAGYVRYDLYHYYHHTVESEFDLPWWFPPSMPTPRLKELRRNHLNHHYGTDGHHGAFGVSTSLWDRVFGTMPKTHDD